MKTFYKINGVITNIITWVVIACVLFAAGTLFAPKFAGIHPYYVLSGSMEPVIHTGSLVYIQEMDEAPEEGDIIAYEAGDGIPVVHRVVETVEGGFITKGDANEIPDANVVVPDKILGECILTVPEAGYLLSAIQSRVFYIGPVTIPLATVILVGIMLLANIIQYIIGLLLPDEENE